jgi:hypothetical protein
MAILELTNKPIIADIDGCCLDPEERIPNAEAKDWEGYHALWRTDTPIMAGCLTYALFIESGHNLIFVTAREEKAREYTLFQLRKFISPNVTSDMLLMRPNDSYSIPDVVLKPQLVQDAGYKIEDILMVFEDRTVMVNEWRRLGVICYQTAQRDD